MSNQPTSGAPASGSNLIEQFMSAGRLLFDGRVPMYLKIMLPIAALVYWVWPIDLIPGLPIDDVAVLAGALYLFVNLASKALNDEAAGAQPNTTQPDDNNVVDTTWRVIK
jgi:uncharacterized membrane protein YkvA (DUF1232 family)